MLSLKLNYTAAVERQAPLRKGSDRSMQAPDMFSPEIDDHPQLNHAALFLVRTHQKTPNLQSRSF